MKQPNEKSSSSSQVVFAAFVWASLVAWSQSTSLPASKREVLSRLADALRAAIDELLREAREQENKALLERPVARATRNASLGALRIVVTDAVATVAKQAGGRSKDDPIVREFLPDLAAGITGASVSDRPRLTMDAASRLEKMAVEFPEKAAIVADLRAAAAAASAAISVTDAAVTDWQRERSEEVTAKTRLRLAVDRTWSLLRAEFPGRRGFVESFFPRAGRTAADPDEAADSDAPADAAPASNS